MTTAKAMGCLLISVSIIGADGQATLSPGERAGAAVVIHRADVLPNQSTNGSPRGGLWPLYSSPEARLNYFAVTSRTPMHFHPDSDHRLYVLEGKIVVICGAVTTTNSPGDFIVIPRGVRHSYDVPSVGDRALLLTFDAPPYDPKKTVNLTPQKAGSP
jgi:mannose-6-phosphate isomerase-like protein (cupin superfamily)